MSFSKVFELILLYLLLQLPCAITSPIGANDPVQHHANHYPLRTGTPPAVVASTPPCHANSTSLSISLSTSVPIRVTTLQSATNLDPSAVATRHSLSVPTKTTGAYPSPSATAESPTELARFLVNCDSDDTAIERETWRDHQKLADAAKKFSPNSKWQEAANIYFGSESSEKKCSEPMQKIMNNHANLHTENHPQRHVAIWCREKGEHSDEPPWGLACRDDSPGYSIPMEHEDLGWIYNIVFCQQFYSDMLKLEAIEWQIDNGRIDKWDAVKMWQSRPLVRFPLPL